MKRLSMIRRFACLVVGTVLWLAEVTPSPTVRRGTRVLTRSLSLFPSRRHHERQQVRFR